MCIWTSTVTSIDYFAFQGSGLTSVAIPESVTEIGYMAFHGVPMTSVDIPKSVTSIGGAAFTSYTIEEINVAEGNSHYKSVNGVLCDYQLQTVVQYPLAKTTFELPESVTAIGDYAFYGCIFTDLTLPSTIKTIGQYAFWYNDLRSITLPEGVTSIDDYAFLNCVYLENINIPSSVNFIGACAFGHCYNLTNPNIDPANKHFKFQDGILYDYGMTTLIECLSSTSSVNISPTVTTIATYAFYSCNEIRDIELPDGLTKIGVCTFSDCRNLISVVIPESVTEIGEGAFNGCYNLISVKLPSKLNTIRVNTFYGCKALRRIVIPESVESIEMMAFYGCDNLQTIVIPNSVKSTDWAIFSSCTNLKTVVIPDALNNITRDTFAFNYNLRRIIALNPTPPSMSMGSFYEVPDDATVYYPVGLRASMTKMLYQKAFGQYTKISDFRLLGDFYAILDLYDLQIEAGATDKLNAYIGQLGRATVAAQRWESSNPEVATVDDNGNVTAVKPGTAIVTYTMTDSNGATYSDTCTVTVGENSAVDEVPADTFDSSEPADVYTLSGILVRSGATQADIDALPAGLYIFRQGSTAKKIAVK